MSLDNINISVYSSVWKDFAASVDKSKLIYGNAMINFKNSYVSSNYVEALDHERKNVFETEYQNSFFDPKKLEAAKEKPKVIRKHKIGDLILAEITKCKLRDYEKSQRVNYIQLGLKDFCDFIQQENLGRISDWMDEVNLIWHEYKIQCVKTEDRLIEVIYLPLQYSDWMTEYIRGTVSQIDYFDILGTNKSGKSLAVKTLKNRHNSVRGMSSTIFVDEYVTINPKV